MKKTTLSLGALIMAAGLSLSACGTDEGELAKEYCDIVEKAKDDPAKAAKEINDWVEENKDKKGDSDEFADAVKEECDVDLSNPLGN